MQKNRDKPLSKNGYVKQDVLKAISGFFIILVIMAAISMFAGIGKGNGGGSSNGGGNTSPGIVGDTTTGNNGSVELPEEELAGVWLLNDTIECIGGEKTFNVNLFYDGVSYSSIAFSTVYGGSGTIPVHYGELMSFDDTAVFYWEVSSTSTYQEGWQNLECKTVIISSTLASVENGAELLAYLKANGTKQSISESPFITFTIEGVIYYAEEGMTWTDWCESVYNVNDAYTSGAGVYKTGTMFDYVSKTGVISDVLGSEQILANYDYKIFHKFATGDVEEPKEEDELPVWNGTDLNGTTWNIPIGFTATSGYGIFDVNFDGVVQGNELDSTQLAIGYDYNFDAGLSPRENIVSILPQYGALSNLGSFTATFTGGTDATNTSLISWLKANGELTSHQMPTPTLINFTIDGVEYQAEEGMTWTDWCESVYNVNDAYTSGAGVYKTGTMFDYVSKTGVISDVLGSEQILANYDYKIFHKFATGDVEEPKEEDELPVWNGTDLNGTTWNIPIGFTATSGYGIFDVNFDGVVQGNELDSTQLAIGYDYNFDAGLSPRENIVSILPQYGALSNLGSFTATFTGGTDATNTSLISWLKANGELTSHQMPTPTLITFTIDGTTYQAEDGMTWEQWIDSAYNTDGMSDQGGSIYSSSSKPIFEKSGCTYGDLDSQYMVIPSDVIVANHAYYSMVGGFG